MSSPNRRPYDPFGTAPAAAASRQQFMPQGWVPNDEQIAEYDRTGNLPEPGQRYGSTGGLLPNQGEPQHSAVDPFEAGRKDRQTADQYYAGATNQPRPSMVSNVTPAGVPVQRPAAPTGMMQIGERNPSARKPGNGQGVIRKGNQVFAYDAGSPVMNPDGTNRAFGSEDEAMNYLDTLRANPIANAGAVTTAAQKGAVAQTPAATAAPVTPASEPGGTSFAPEAVAPAAAGPTAAQAPAAPARPAAGLAPITSIKGLAQRVPPLSAIASDALGAVNTVTRLGGSLVNGLWNGNFQAPGVADMASNAFSRPSPVGVMAGRAMGGMMSQVNPQAQMPAAAPARPYQPAGPMGAIEEPETYPEGAPMRRASTLREKNTPRKGRAYQVVAQRFNPFATR